MHAIIKGDYIMQARYPFITFRHYAMALLIILAGLAWWNIKLKGFDSLLGFFERFAPISYALYITHFIFITLSIPYINPYIALLIRLSLAFLTAYLLEIKMQPIVNTFFFKKK